MKNGQIINVKYKMEYMDAGDIPSIGTDFELKLFNTFRSFMEVQQIYPKKLTTHTDQRGMFSEVIRVKTGGQVSAIGSKICCT